MEVIRNLQHELPYLSSNNERLLKSNVEQERMIRGLNKNYSNKIMEPEMGKGKETESKKFESGGESNSAFPSGFTSTLRWNHGSLS